MNRKHIIRNLRLKGIPFDENLSTKELNALLTAPDAQNRISKKFNCAGGARISLAFNAAKEDEPAQIMVCEDIGKDAWTGEGISVQDIQTTLDAVTPRTRPLNFLIDSPGGSYNVGCSIHNLLSQWPGVINKTIIGVAASTASWMIPADKTFAYKNSQIFAHRAMCVTFGNEDDHQEAIDYIKKTNGQISQMYADQSGNEPDAMLDMMKGKDGNGTLLTGEEAKKTGLVDEIIDGEAANQFSTEWLNSARKKLSAINSLRSAPGTDADAGRANNHNPASPGFAVQAPNQNQNMKEKIALLNKRGITVPQNAAEAEVDKLIADSNLGRKTHCAVLNKWKVAHDAENMTDLQLAELVENGKPAAQPHGLDDETKNMLQGMKNQIANQRRKDIRTEVQNAATLGKIPANEIENWESDAFAAVDHPTNGNPVLNRLNKLEGRAPGVPPIPETVNKLEVSGADFRDIRKGFEAHNEATKSWQRGNNISMKEIANASKAKAIFTAKFRNRFIEMMNTNTIDAGLQRQFILQDIVIRDFKRRILPLDLFATVFRNVPLEGTDVVEVPYYDLDTTVSAPYAGSYDSLVSNTSSGVRPITVGWGPNKDGALGVGHCRLVQALSFTSQEIARQPYLKIAQLAALKAEKLAYDIFRDVLGVATVANYPTLLDSATSISCPYNLFSSDNLADLKVLCKAWPMEGRGLIIDSAYDGNLMKDPTFKAAYQQAFDTV